MNSNKFIKIIASSLLTLFTLSAFATDEDCIKEHSYGWCMLDLVGYSKGAKDMPVEEIKPLLEKIQKNGNELPEASVDKVSLLIAATDYANIGIVPFSPGIAGTIGLFSSFGNLIPNPGDRDHLIVMLPESEVKDGDPRLTIENMFIEGAKSYLKASKAVRQDIVVSSFFSNYVHLRGYLLTGGDRCGDTGCYAKTEFIEYADANPGFVEPKIIDKPPSWAAKEKVYTWVVSFPYIYMQPKDGWNKVGAPGPGIIKQSEYPDFIKSMPSSFYLHKAGKLSAIFNGDKMNLFIH